MGKGPNLEIIRLGLYPLGKTSYCHGKLPYARIGLVLADYLHDPRLIVVLNGLDPSVVQRRIQEFDTIHFHCPGCDGEAGINTDLNRLRCEEYRVEFNANKRISSKRSKTVIAFTETVYMGHEARCSAYLAVGSKHQVYA